jgi:hypothetical protein
MEQLAQEIVDIFEENSPIPTSTLQWLEKSEEILLYLAALKYLEKHT